MLRKLRVKFVCIVMVIVTVMLCVIFGLVLHFTGQSLEQESDALLLRAAEPGFLTEPHSAGGSLPFFLIRQDFRGNLQFSGTVAADRYTESEWLALWCAASEAEDQTGLIEGYDLKYLRTAGPTACCVFVDISSQRMVMRSLTRISAAVAVLSFALLLGASVVLAHWAVKPVEDAWQQQRQFVADASHELKTPLTVIMTNAELLQEPECEDGQRQRFSESILTMSRQMRSLVEGLLELARVDNGAVKTSFAPLDMSALAAQEIMTFEPLFFERELALHYAIAPGIRVRGSERHLHQVMGILLDNALKYTTPQGQVWVRLSRQGGGCLLSVASAGEPISPADLKNIFRRFYRIDKARSRDGSYGLGLSIAQSIVQEHRGRIWAQSADGSNVFFVQLPANGGKER